ncbi:MAG: RNA-binding domain-containing protein [Candidatus Ranarchaeia archaeon]
MINNYREKFIETANDLKVKVEIKTLFFPTEDVEKIMSAFSSIVDIDNSKFKKEIREEEENNWLSVSMNSVFSLAPIYKQIRNQRIIGHTRKLLRSQVFDFDNETRQKGEVIVFLNKQHAVYGKIHFSPKYGESPLGSISLTITSDDIQLLINWLAPYTEGGKIRGNIPPIL